MNNDNFLDELFGDDYGQNMQGAQYPAMNNNVQVMPGNMTSYPDVNVMPQNVQVPNASPVQEEPKEQKERSEESTKVLDKINKLLEIYGVDKKNRFTFENSEDLVKLIDGIKVIKENIKSLKAAFGEEAGEELLELIPDENILFEMLRNLLEERMKRREELRNDEEALAAEEEAFYNEVESNKLLATMLLCYGIATMIRKRMANKIGDENGSTSLQETGGSTRGIITEEDKEKYLKDLFRKLAIIERYTGIQIDRNLIDFFKSDEYIFSDEMNLPDILRDEDFERIKNAWSLPVLINDNREELKSQEIEKAETSVNALEGDILRNNMGNTQDNPAIQQINRLKGDVQEEKERIEKDNKFFTDEKLKERVECALLYSVKGQTQNPTVHNLSNALKETITGRINYMEDETKLRDERKKENSDKSLKDNERNSDEYHSKLTSANDKVNERREKRAKGEIKFIPKAVEKKRQMANQPVNTMNQGNYDKGKAMVLKNNWNRFNNMAS